MTLHLVEERLKVIRRYDLPPVSRTSPLWQGCDRDRRSGF
ncbi:hypothetical protein [Azospirillum doebereinerae]